MLAKLYQLYLPLTWPVLVAMAYAVMSLVTLITFGLDKSAARGGRRRVPEATLHVLALLGGWPGSLIGMSIFRHKRRKTRFVVFTSLIALAHVAAWAWWLTRARG